MLAIPFDLCTGISPIRQPNHSSIVVSNTQVPAFHRSVNAGSCHKVWISCMPVDIRNGSSMSKDEAGKARGW
jgi:hypothetical protein